MGRRAWGMCFCSHCLPWRRARSKHKGRKSSLNAVGGFLGQSFGGECQISATQTQPGAHRHHSGEAKRGHRLKKKKEPRRDSSWQRRLTPLPLSSGPHTGSPELTGTAAPRPAQRLPPAICLPRRPGRVWARGGAAAWRAGRCWPASGPGSGRRGRPDTGSGDGQHGGGGWGRGGWLRPWGSPQLRPQIKLALSLRLCWWLGILGCFGVMAVQLGCCRCSAASLARESCPQSLCPASCSQQRGQH